MEVLFVAFGEKVSTVKVEIISFLLSAVWMHSNNFLIYFLFRQFKILTDVPQALVHKMGSYWFCHIASKKLACIKCLIQNVWNLLMYVFYLTTKHYCCFMFIGSISVLILVIIYIHLDSYKFRKKILQFYLSNNLSSGFLIPSL